MSWVTREAGQLLDVDLGRQVHLEDGTSGRLTGTCAVADRVSLTIDGQQHTLPATAPVVVTIPSKGHRA